MSAARKKAEAIAAQLQAAGYPVQVGTFGLTGAEVIVQRPKLLGRSVVQVRGNGVVTVDDTLPAALREKIGGGK